MEARALPVFYCRSESSLPPWGARESAISSDTDAALFLACLSAPQPTSKPNLHTAHMECFYPSPRHRPGPDTGRSGAMKHTTSAAGPGLSAITHRYFCARRCSPAADSRATGTSRLPVSPAYLPPCNRPTFLDTACSSQRDLGRVSAFCPPSTPLHLRPIIPHLPLGVLACYRKKGGAALTAGERVAWPSRTTRACQCPPC
ncbi:hypothetical protein B0H16DRAFT_1886979 [Mycena metata]|uniref:Uncharacterized protein n=1 Tax=Mycena metata TaxID=1033252 RepID=A0AAD7J2L5_9AGAR|nr:hypothetical protein B0H16DRAFT_1886979 [Mycena metata]